MGVLNALYRLVQAFNTDHYHRLACVVIEEGYMVTAVARRAEFKAQPNVDMFLQQNRLSRVDYRNNHPRIFFRTVRHIERIILFDVHHYIDVDIVAGFIVGGIEEEGVGGFGFE